MVALAAALVLCASSASPPAVEWSRVQVLGWSKDDSTVAWEAEVDSTDGGPGGPAGQLVFRLFTDADGRLTRIFRSSRRPEDQVWPMPPAAEAAWSSAEPEEECERWLAANPSDDLPNDHAMMAPVVDRGGREPLSLSVSLSGRGCATASLTASLGTATGVLVEDRCPPGEQRHSTITSGTSVSWSRDRSRAAVSWNLDRTIGPPREADSVRRGYLAVATRRALAAVDLLDAGAAGAVDALAGAIEAAGFRVGHRGKAGKPRKASEVYFAPGFEAEARELAALVGAAPEAVKPLSWKSPFALTVAAGPRGASPRSRPLRSRARAGMR